VHGTNASVVIKVQGRIVAKLLMTANMISGSKAIKRGFYHGIFGVSRLALIVRIL
jgi:hypothetical protein